MVTSPQEPQAGLAYTTIALAAIPLLVIILSKLISPRFDSQEPQPIWPTIPLVGHIISLVRGSSTFYPRLFKSKKLPICSLPMLNGKVYVINSPAMIDKAMKNGDLSFDPFAKELVGKTFGFQPAHMRLLHDDQIYHQYIGKIAGGLSGPSLAKLNIIALNFIATSLDPIQEGKYLDIPDPLIWLRDIMGTSIAGALFGDHNPITPEIFAELGDFEQGLALISQGLGFAARKAVAARDVVTAALAKYYAAGYDQHPSVSDMMRSRAVMDRANGLTPSEIASWEVSILFVGSTNTVPTLFWCFANIFSRPELVARIREEVTAYVTLEEGSDGGRIATIDAGNIEKGCPLLGGAFRETMRLYVHNLGIRRVMRDTTLRDPDSGREYLLRKDVDVHWHSALTHALPDVWADENSFKPDRFVKVPAAEEKKRRGAMIPFGGGKHYCPGRNFALAENLGFLAMLALAFDVEGVRVPGSDEPPAGLGTRKIVWGNENKGVRMKKKDGWADVKWRFTS